MDADDLVVGTLPIPTDKTPDCYTLIYGVGFTYDRIQMFRSDLKWKYLGVLHEYPICTSRKNPWKKKLTGDYYIDSRRLGARNKCDDKYQRDAKLLLQGLKEEPNNSRYVFYLAQSYMDAKDYEKSIEWYQKRSELEGWFEEVFYSLYRIATNKQELNYPWPEVEAAYLKAWEYLPRRAEPLFEIGRHYRKNEEWRKAYNILRKASKIEFPKELELFLFQSVYDYEILEEMAFCAYKLRRYEEAFNIYQQLLFEEWRGVPEYLRPRLEKNRDMCVEFLLDDTAEYPVKEVIKARSKKEDNNQVIFTVTTCKRLDLFTKTINSFLNCCKDFDKIDKWICVDDNSSQEDRDKMQKLYPFFTFIWKNEEQKGHVESMNIIHSLIEKYRYNIHMEDDWHFFEPREYITQAIEILEKEDDLGQVLFNRNYAERCSCRTIAGGKYANNSSIRFLYHEYAEENTQEWEKFNQDYAGKFTCFYWPHYSLRPSVLKIEALMKIGPYLNVTGHFEMDYAREYVKKGYRSAFFDTISCWHIGKCTWEKGDNSYSLNGVQQFAKQISDKEDPDWIIVDHMDSFGNDIQHVKEQDIDKLKELAIKDPNCIGFNSLGYLKSKISDKEEWISVNYPKFQMYIYKKRWQE
jgi:tetratricopeptide (TPR) repeat protein